VSSRESVVGSQQSYQRSPCYPLFPLLPAELAILTLQLTDKAGFHLLNFVVIPAERRQLARLDVTATFCNGQVGTCFLALASRFVQGLGKLMIRALTETFGNQRRYSIG